MRKVKSPIDVMKAADVFSLDFETKTFDDKDVVCYSMAAVAESGDVVYGVWPGYMMPDLLKHLAKKRVVFHNFKFDGKVLHHYGFKPESIRYEDTILMARLLNDEGRVGLKDCGRNELGMDMHDFSEDAQADYIAGKNTVEFEKYSADDAIATILLFHKFRERIKAEDLVSAYMLELKIVIPVMYMELNGIAFGFEKCEELEELTKEKCIEIEDKIYAMAGRVVGLSAPVDLAAFLFDELKIPYKADYSRGLKGKGRSVRREVLDTLAMDLRGDPREEVINDIIEWKRLNKMKTSFFAGQRECAKKWPDGRVRSSFNQVAVVTGRFANSDPNLQQLPVKPIVGNDSNTSIRAMYVPAEGCKFIDVDFSQIELRLLAHFSQDKNMIEGFWNGEDFHQRTVVLTGNKISRKDAKVANFGMVYGMSPYGFAYQARIDVQDAMQYYRDYNKQFPGVQQLRERVKQAVLANGYVRFIGGRKRRIYSELDEGAIERIFLNALIQGSAAIVLKLAIIACFEKFQNRECRMVLQVHDEVVFEVPENKTAHYVQEIKDAMENCIKISVPLVAEPKICNHFGEAKD